MSTHVKHNQSSEDYLESVLMLSRQQEVVHRIDVAKRMNVSQAAVNKAVKILVEKGYIYEDGKHLYLSEEGKRYAEAVYEKHCIIRDYLISCGVSAAAAEEDACNMEHLISEETFTMMKTTLNK
ncbi:MAG: metal-dependent transcriptional regulator [Clostridia bacterium]|nr:metal-dependent transcriptional regulator [Clostridia bacterium]